MKAGVQYGLGGAKLSQYAERKMNKRAHQGGVAAAKPQIVEAIFPAIEFAGIKVPSTSIAFKRVDNKLESVSIEAEPSVLFYIKMATLLKGMRTESRVRDTVQGPSKHRHVRWRKKQERVACFPGRWFQQNVPPRRLR